MSTVLSMRALNRALLARQHLLERATMPAARMIEHLVGMQAQVPVNPYHGLWSRLVDFQPAELEGLILERAAVRISFLRTTLHLVTARDALRLRPLLQDVLRRGYASGSPFHKDLVGVDLDALVAAGRELMDAEALTTAALGARLADRWPERNPVSLAYAVRYLLPLVQVPPRGLWSQSGQPRWRPLESWLAQPLSTGAEPKELVLRYLAAFGPAGLRDIATWSWMTKVRDVVDDLRPQLRTFRDEAGKELFDLPDAPLPDEDTPAPIRFLPEYDNIALSHGDRSRIIDRAATGRITGYVGTFLVDGFIAGQWCMAPTPNGRQLVLDPFTALNDIQLAALVAEGERLLNWEASSRGEASGGVAIGLAREA
jgi:Winged helix DNA-binding domain